MKTIINPKNQSDMKLLKFFLAAVAGFGLVKIFGFFSEDELDEEMEDLYENEDHPLFV
ncbi:MAG: hypothetical protein ACLGH8_04220 [Bacteroidia bacterium]|jgi:hypothetical protein